jgi:hypothetical protein
MNEWRNLPSQEELSRFANWGLISVGVMSVAAGVPIGLSKLVAGLSFALAMGVFGVLMIPVFVCMGIAFRHLAKCFTLRKSERSQGRAIPANGVGRFMDAHPIGLASVVIAGALAIAVVWTVLEHK